VLDQRMIEYCYVVHSICRPFFGITM
jgi:hypothetical protein